MKKIIWLVLCSICLSSCKTNRFSPNHFIDNLKSSNEINIKTSAEKFKVCVSNPKILCEIALNPSVNNYEIAEVVPWEGSTDEQIEIAKNFIEKYFFIDKDKMNNFFPYNSPNIKIWVFSWMHRQLDIKIFDNEKKDYKFFEYTCYESYFLLKRYSLYKNDEIFTDQCNFIYTTNYA